MPRCYGMAVRCGNDFGFVSLYAVQGYRNEGIRSGTARSAYQNTWSTVFGKLHRNAGAHWAASGCGSEVAKRKAGRDLFQLAYRYATRFRTGDKRVYLVASTRLIKPSFNRRQNQADNVVLADFRVDFDKMQRF